LSSRQKKRAAKRVEVDVKREEKRVNKKIKKQAREMYESDSDDDLPKNLLKTRTEALKVKKPAQNGVKKPAQNGVKDKKPVKNVPKATVIKVQNSAGESEDEEEENSDASLQFEDSEAEQGSDEEMEAESDDDDANEPQVGKLNDLFADSDDEQAAESASDQSEASEDEEELGSDDEDENDDDLLPIEKANKKLKQIIDEEAKQSKAELAASMANKEAFEFPEETEKKDGEPISLADVQIRIRDVIGVLSDFAKNRDPNRTRAEYLDLLRKDLCLYYSYNEFMMSAYMKIFPISELMEFLEASEVQRPLTIRTNTLKVRRRDLAQALINRGVNLDPVGKWSKIGLVVYSSSVPMGATPEYLSGQYMIQGASSMLPVMTLDPQENERILDMCAAPGGKSSHIAALMKNTGTLFSNDLKRDRIHGIIGNFHRLGVENSVVSGLIRESFHVNQTIHEVFS
jgi:25S rRNA (cytosine2870-C5)-methyltransferase